MKGKILFRESQTFRYSWSWYLVILVSVYIFWTLGRGLYTQWAEDESWSENPTPDLTLIIITMVTFVVIIGIFLFIHFHRLELQVDEGSIRYRFIPYFSSFRTINKDDLKEVYVRKYKPLLEFGGWGYRIRPGKKAFNVKGNKGLQLIFKGGKKLLIGTQQAPELEKAIDRLKENWRMI